MKYYQLMSSGDWVIANSLRSALCQLSASLGREVLKCEVKQRTAKQILDRIAKRS